MCSMRCSTFSARSTRPAAPNAATTGVYVFTDGSTSAATMPVRPHTTLAERGTLTFRRWACERVALPLGLEEVEGVWSQRAVSCWLGRCERTLEQRKCAGRRVAGTVGVDDGIPARLIRRHTVVAHLLQEHALALLHAARLRVITQHMPAASHRARYSAAV
jgi:hypothetical protein